MNLIPAFKTLPAEPVSDADRAWLDRVAQCSTSCARTIESRQMRSNEVPLVMASLIIAFADQTGLPLTDVLSIIGRAVAVLKSETPEVPA